MSTATPRPNTTTPSSPEAPAKAINKPVVFRLRAYSDNPYLAKPQRRQLYGAYSR